MKKIKEFLISMLALLFGIEMNTIAVEAYKKLKDVPDWQWIPIKLTDGREKCCVLGHYGRLSSGFPEDYSQNNVVFNPKSDLAMKTLEDYTARFLASRSIKSVTSNSIITIAQINDSAIWGPYIESSRKERVLKLLSDMIKAGW